MGWLRKKRRRRLIEALLNEGKIIQYKKKLVIHLEKMNALESKWVKRVQDNYKTDENLALLTIEQIRELKTTKEKVQKVHSYLELIESKTENQAIYEEFIDYLQTLQDVSKKSPSRRKTKRVIRKSNSAIEDLNDWIELIDKRISKADKESLNKENRKKDSKEKIDIEEFLKTYE
jgi:hypothetical protein